MKTIELDVEGLPEPFVQAVKMMVDTLREELKGRDDKRRPVELLIKDGYVLGKDAPHPPVELPVWPGKVIGSLTREEIYEDDD